MNGPATDGHPARAAMREPAARRLAAPTTAVVLVGVTLLLLVLDVPLEVSTGTFSASWALGLLITLPFTFVGMIVARRQPHNPLGWLLMLVSLLTTLGGVASDYALFVFRFGHGGRPLGSLAVFFDLGSAGAILAPLVILLFPDGRLGRPWRWLLRVYMFMYAVYIAGHWSMAIAALRRATPVDSAGNVAGVGHPAGFAAWFAPVRPVLVPILVLFCIASVGRQVLSYRASTGVRRQQLKWFGAGGVMCIGCMLLAVSNIANSAPVVAWVLILGGFSALPASIGVAILKYRLYEIDRLISRTLSYAILTALLASTFVGLVALSTEVLPFSSPVGVAASTLAAATLFNPLRKRVQRTVDRRFNRSRYDAEATVAAFSARLRDAVEIDAIRSDLLATVKHAVQPSHATVWIRPNTRD